MPNNYSNTKAETSFYERSIDERHLFYYSVSCRITRNIIRSTDDMECSRGVPHGAPDSERRGLEASARLVFSYITARPIVA